MCMFSNMINVNSIKHFYLSEQKKIIFTGISKVCPMTEFSGAGEKIDFDGDTIFLECQNNEYAYTSGLEIFEFKTSDKNQDFISLMGNNMIPYTFAIGEKYT